MQDNQPSIGLLLIEVSRALKKCFEMNSSSKEIEALSSTKPTQFL